MSEFFFKSLPIDHLTLNAVLSEIKIYVDSLRLNPYSVDVRPQYGVDELNIDETVKRCPTLVEYLNHLGCDSIWHNIVIFTSPMSNQQSPDTVAHRDYVTRDGQIISDSYLAITFPLENCRWCPTYMYHPLDVVHNAERSSPNSLRQYMPQWAPVHKQSWVMAGCYHLTGPMLINTNQWHNVINRTNQLRSSFSLRFQKNPWHLTR